MSDFEFIDPIEMWITMRVKSREHLRLVCDAIGLVRKPGETHRQLRARIVERTKTVPRYREAAEKAIAIDSEFGARR